MRHREDLPLVLGDPDGRSLRVRALAPFRGHQVGREFYAGGTELDSFLGTFIALADEDSTREAPRRPADLLAEPGPDDPGVDVELVALDDLDHESLKELAANMGLDDKGNATTLRARIREAR